MKTFNFKLTAILFLFALCSAKKTSAQTVNVPFGICDALGCDISGTYSIYIAGGTCGSISDLCDTQPFTTAAYNCTYISQFGTGAACSPFDAEGVCIIIEITDIGTTTLTTPIIVSSNGGSPITIFNVAPPCTQPSTFYTIIPNTFVIQN